MTRGNTTDAWRARVLVAVVAMVAIGASSLAACGSSSKTATDTTDTTETSIAAAETTATTSADPSAADDLAPFAAAAVETDHLLKTAADAVNAGIGPDTVTFDGSTDATVAAAEPNAVAAEIPAGMDPTLERAVLLVYSGLESRYRSLRQGSCLRIETFPRSELDPACFSQGHAAAVRFDDDLAAARSRAASLPPLTPAALDSHAAAELAVRVAYTNLANSGCDGGGGYLATEPVAVDWKAEGEWDGRVDGVPFTATFAAGTGWKVSINAC